MSDELTQALQSLFVAVLVLHSRRSSWAYSRGCASPR